VKEKKSKSIETLYRKPVSILLKYVLERCFGNIRFRYNASNGVLITEDSYKTLSRCLLNIHNAWIRLREMFVFLHTNEAYTHGHLVLESTSFKDPFVRDFVLFMIGAEAYFLEEVQLNVKIRLYTILDPKS
jgi:hypothetical protein